MNDKKFLKELISYSVANIDKPRGLTSREVVNRIKKILGLNKCGHTGTLDPNVIGVLVVAFEEAVKIMPVLIGLDKEYEGILYLHKDVDEKILGNVISENFVGAITQVPPVKSNVARKPRERIVYSFDILDKDEKNVKFRTKVQAGTYIRKLCSDIGKKLGVGGHMKELRRTKVGHFDEKNSHSLDELKNKLENILIPIEEAIPHVKKVYVKKSSVESIYNGAPVRKSDIERMDEGISPGENVGIFFSDKLIALGISRGRSIRIDRIIRK